MSLDRLASGGRSPVFGRSEATPFRAGLHLAARACLVVLAFLFLLHVRPDAAHADAAQADAASRLVYGQIVQGPSAPPADKAGAGVETIRRSPQAHALRIEATQFAIPAGKPAIFAENFADTPFASPHGRITETRGSGAPVRAPPATTHIL